MFFFYYFIHSRKIVFNLAPYILFTHWIDALTIFMYFFPPTHICFWGSNKFVISERKCFQPSFRWIGIDD